MLILNKDLDAKRCRELTDEWNRGALKREFEKVMHEICEAAAKGATQCQIKSLSPAMRIELEARGFIIKECRTDNYPCNEYLFFYVSWLED